ncbi:MAG: hypothetical protein MUF30_07165 [Burkholderiales bacterium]|jgi:hypothetical protein|nr:hypothetical protein [Burkholderiales bacterium]
MRAIPRRRRATRRDSRGVALLALLIVAAVFGVVAWTTFAVTRATVAEREARTRTALNDARRALIAYAASYMARHPPRLDTITGLDTVFGLLPCPDQGAPGSLREGAASGTCGATNVSALGRLPWYTLDIAPLRDGDGECLWYAVSGSFKNTPKRPVVNWDTPGLLEVANPDGSGLPVQGVDRAVAVVFAPGAPLGNQNRAAVAGATECGGNFVAANYLDTRDVAGTATNNAVVSATANAITRFVQGAATTGFNDRVAVITVRDLYDALEREAGVTRQLQDLARRTAQCLANWAATPASPPVSIDRRLPYTTLVVAGTGYAPGAAHPDEPDVLSGRPPATVQQSNADTGRFGPIELLPTAGPFGAPGRCPTVGNAAWTPTQAALFANWKDHLFYAVAAGYAADRPGGGNCTPACLSVNGGVADVGGVVIFAGRPVGGQVRDTDVDRGNVANWLEGRNATNHPNTGGNGNYQSGAASATFNDQVWCLRPPGPVGVLVAAAC